MLLVRLHIPVALVDRTINTGVSCVLPTVLVRTWIVAAYPFIELCIKPQ